MMQSAVNYDVNALVKGGMALAREGQTIAQDAGRSAPLAPNTVMAKVAESGKWIPLTDLAATDGTAIPQGIYMGDEIAAASLVAGDVVDAPVLVGGGCMVDGGQLVLENGLTLDDVISISASVEHRTVRDRLESRGIFIEDAEDIAAYENA